MERVEDLADVLAYHSFEALELARASGGDLAGLEERALRFLVLAGDRAKGLDPARAGVMYERALSLAPEGDPIRGEILHDLGYVEFQRGRYRRSRDLLQEAIPALYAAGKPARAADVKVFLRRRPRHDRAIEGPIGVCSTRRSSSSRASHQGRSSSAPMRGGRAGTPHRA